MPYVPDFVVEAHSASPPSRQQGRGIFGLVLAGLFMGAVGAAAVYGGFGHGASSPVGRPPPAVVQATMAPVAAAGTTTAAVAAPPTETPSATLSPSDPLFEAQAARAQGDPGRAIEILLAQRQVRGQSPEFDDALYGAYMAHGRALLFDKNLDLSYAMFGEALKVRPNDSEALDGQKRVVLTKNWNAMEANWTANPDAAIAALEENLRLDPGFRESDTREKLYALLVSKGDRLLRDGDRQGAYGVLMRALELRPERPDARQRLAAFIPTPVPTATRIPVSLANGTFLLTPQYRQGPGTLTIQNGSSRDAVAKLKGASGSSTFAAIYIRAGSEVVLRNIGPGTYALQFMTGVDWDVGTGKFMQDVNALQFRETFSYRETPTASGTQYQTFRVTLNPVVGGTAQTERIDPATFARD